MLSAKFHRTEEMKIKIQIYLSFWLVCLMAIETAFASETRVDSAGGLTSIIDDETNNGDIFLDGNPAGLVLLKTHDRFDLSAQWDYSNSQPVGVGSSQQTFATVPRLSTDSLIRYGGLMVFTDTHWAFQVDGDYLNPQNQVANNYLADSYSTQQYRELVRAAYDSGPFCFGLEVTNVEDDDVYAPGQFSASIYQSSGISSENATHIRAGIITTFPENPDPDSPLWEVGGIFETQIGADVAALDAMRFLLTPPGVNLQQNNATNQYYYFGPEVRYELPGRLILKFYSFITNDYVNRTQSSSLTSLYPALSSYVFSQYQAMNNVGTFRLSLPLSDKENLKLGGSIIATLTNTDVLGPAENVINNDNRQQINGTFGIGLESPNDYTYGIQFSSQNYLLDQQAVVSKILTATDYNLYQIALGGEKWLWPDLALRAGLVVEDDIYSESMNQTTLTATGTVGLGFQNPGVKLDTKFLLGQGNNLSGEYGQTTLLGAEIQGTFFL